MRRAVITGYGVVGTFGQGKDSFANALTQGDTGISPVTLFDTNGCRCHHAAEAKLIGLDTLGGRAGKFLSLATDEALADAGLTGVRHCITVFQGTAHGSLDLWEHNTDTCGVLPARLGEATWKKLAEQVSVTTLTSACVASTYAAGLALHAIRHGKTDLALIVGAEVLTNFLFRGFDALRLLTPSSCRPFDQLRDGLILGEGAAVLVLESEAAAHKRGARIRAELVGFGAASDANHLTAPDISGKGAAAALIHALKDSGSVGGIDYINMHGTGTIHNDRMELNALKRVFGCDTATIPISSTKSMTGHTSGAAGAVELAVCLAALEREFIPPTIGLEKLDPMCKGFDMVTKEARQKRCNILVNINSGFGGNNAALVLRRYS